MEEWTGAAGFSPILEDDGKSRSNKPFAASIRDNKYKKDGTECPGEDHHLESLIFCKKSGYSITKVQYSITKVQCLPI